MKQFVRPIGIPRGMCLSASHSSDSEYGRNSGCRNECWTNTDISFDIIELCTNFTRLENNPENPFFSFPFQIERMNIKQKIGFFFPKCCYPTFKENLCVRINSISPLRVHVLCAKCLELSATDQHIYFVETIQKKFLIRLGNARHIYTKFKQILSLNSVSNVYQEEFECF